ASAPPRPEQEPGPVALGATGAPGPLRPPRPLLRARGPAMSDRAAFLRAICERPDEDGPRLVYADWLEERGDPRGEFIRVQCRLGCADADALAGWAPLRRLRRLQLDGLALDAGGVAAVAASPHLGGLRRLDLRRNHLDAAAAAALAGNPALAGLEALDLRFC